MINESVKLKGRLNVTHLGQGGEVKNSQDVDNLVVAVGKDLIASRLIGNTLPVPSHMAIGSSSTAAATSQTTLLGELGRVALDSAGRTSNTNTYIATFPAGTGTGEVVEAGIFNDSSSGNMLCRTTFSAVNKAAGDTIIITWNLTVA